MKQEHLLSVILTVAVASVVIIGSAYALKSWNHETPAPASGNGNEPAGLTESEKQDLVEDYLKDNISELSPEPAVLGGTFYVTEVIFDEEGRTEVRYEDGHIALVADAGYRVNDGGAVEITAFELQDEYGVPDFKETGNLTQEQGVWTLVYEKPGAPALTVELEFGDISRCLDEYADQSCSPEYWQAGDRAEVIGYRVNDRVLVSQLRIIGEASQSISGGGERATELPVTNFEECVAAGYEAMYPDCVDCAAYCDTPDGQRFEEESLSAGSALCEDLCGNGSCEEVVCLAEGCPCAETPDTCPEDCL